MTDNTSESNKKLQEYSQQMGFDALVPNETIESAPETIGEQPFDEQDLEGSTDSQSRAKNPVFQYAAAALIGTVFIGLPLSAFFSLGGGTTVAKKDAQETSQQAAAETSDPEVDKLRTNIALDVQNPSANADTVQKPAPPQDPQSQKPKAPPPAKVAKSTPPPKPAPVAKVAPTQKIAQPAPSRSVTPVPIPVQQPIAIQPKPQPTLIAAVPKPVPQPRIAATPQAIPAVKTAPQPEHSLSFQEASALSQYGGDGDSQNVAQTHNPQNYETLSLAAQNVSPALSLPVGTAVFGHTITPYNSISKGNNQGSSDVSVALDQPIQLAQGYSLPVGTVIQFAVTVGDNGLIQATSKGVYIDNSAIKVPAGTFALTSQNNEALVAQQRAMRQDELASADTKTAMYGAISNVGQVLTNAGTQTVLGSTGIGTVTGIQTNSSNPNILSAAAQGAFSPLLSANQSRTSAIASEIQGLSRINTLPIQTRVKVFVSAPGVVQIPVASNRTTSAQAPTQSQTAMKVIGQPVADPGIQQDRSSQINTPQNQSQPSSTSQTLYPQTPPQQVNLQQAQPQQVNTQSSPTSQINTPQTQPQQVKTQQTQPQQSPTSQTLYPQTQSIQTTTPQQVNFQQTQPQQVNTQASPTSQSLYPQTQSQPVNTQQTQPQQVNTQQSSTSQSLYPQTQSQPVNFQQHQPQQVNTQQSSTSQTLYPQTQSVQISTPQQINFQQPQSQQVNTQQSSTSQSLYSQTQSQPVNFQQTPTYYPELQ